MSVAAHEDDIKRPDVLTLLETINSECNGMAKNLIISTLEDITIPFTLKLSSAHASSDIYSIGSWSFPIPVLVPVCIIPLHALINYFNAHLHHKMFVIKKSLSPGAMFGDKYFLNLFCSFNIRKRLEFKKLFEFCFNTCILIFECTIKISTFLCELYSFDYFFQSNKSKNQ